MLEAFFGICVACILFYVLILCNLTTKETKEKCSTLFNLITDETLWTDTSQNTVDTQKIKSVNHIQTLPPNHAVEESESESYSYTSVVPRK